MEDSDSVYYSKLVHKLAMVLLVVGGLNWGLVGFKRVNLVDRLLGKGSFWATVIYVLVGLSALLVAFNRDTYLPFLGESVFPVGVLQNQIPPGATRSISVKVQPNVKVVYWASEPGDGHSNYKAAYGQYQNAGVTQSDSTGTAVLKVREPQAYSVPLKGRLQPHVHFRTFDHTGFVGRIKTVFLADGRVEGFSV